MVILPSCAMAVSPTDNLLSIPTGTEAQMKKLDGNVEKTQIIDPGVGFGKLGEGFVRFALTQPEEKINEAIDRINKMQ